MNDHSRHLHPSGVDDDGYLEDYEPAGVLDERRKVVTVSDAVRHLWRGRIWIVGSASLGLALALVFLIFTAVSAPSLTTYRSAISLTMKGAAPGFYPSGAPFAPSDLRSPVVLEAAFSASGLEKYGYTLGEFSKSLDTQAYSPNIEGVTQRFRARATARNVTPEEVKSAEEIYRQELAAAKYEGVLISFSADGKYGVPDDLGRRIVDSIPALWSQIFVESFGVTSFPVAKSVASLIDTKVVSSLDYPLIFDYIDTSASKLDQRLLDISAIPSANNITVGAPPLTLLDLQRRSQNIRSFQIEKVLRPLVDNGLSRAAELTVMAYENKSQVLSLEAVNEERKSASISNLIRERNASDAQAGASPAPSSGSAAPSSPVISTIGDTSVDKIVSLSLSSAGTEFKEKLLNRKLDIETEIALKVKERQIIDRRLIGLRSAEAAVPSERRERLTKVFDLASVATITELNDIWQLGNDLLSNLTADRLSQEKLLYISSPIAGSEMSTPFYRSLYLWAVFFGLIIIFALIGLMAYLLFSIVRQGRQYRRAQS